MKCQAPGHPDCSHQCDKGECVAFYEPETGMCIKGCDGELLSVGVVTTIERSGWLFRSNGEVSGIQGFHLIVLSRLVQASTRRRGLKGAPNANILPLAGEVIRLGQSAREKRFSFTWRESPLQDLFETIIGQLK